MDMGNSIGQIREYSEVIMLMIRSRDMVSISGQMVGCIRENGMMESNMELVIILTHKQKLRRENGIMARS